jgi:hypothetical protein
MFALLLLQLEQIILRSNAASLPEVLAYRYHLFNGVFS